MNINNHPTRNVLPNINNPKKGAISPVINKAEFDKERTELIRFEEKKNGISGHILKK